MNRTIACMVRAIAPNESAPFVNGTMRASFIGTDEEGRSFAFEADVYKSEARDLGALLYVPNAPVGPALVPVDLTRAEPAPHGSTLPGHDLDAGSES